MGNGPIPLPPNGPIHVRMGARAAAKRETAADNVFNNRSFGNIPPSHPHHPSPPVPVLGKVVRVARVVRVVRVV